MALSAARRKYLWRTKYPWVIVFYIFMFGVLAGVLKQFPERGMFNLDLYMIAVFTSMIFLYIFYIYGVRPVELEHHFQKK